MKVFSLLTGWSYLLGPFGFWRLALPVEVCSLECNNKLNIKNPKNLHFQGLVKISTFLKFQVSEESFPRRR